MLTPVVAFRRLAYRERIERVLPEPLKALLPPVVPEQPLFRYAEGSDALTAAPFATELRAKMAGAGSHPRPAFSIGSTPGQADAEGVTSLWTDGTAGRVTRQAGSRPRTSLNGWTRRSYRS